MRLYSNRLLSWPQLLHAYQAARVYPGRWHHFYFYKIKTVNPLAIITYSPIELLQENCKYYCYDKYERDKRLENYGNTVVSATIHNKQIKLGEETWVHIPKMTNVDDIIVIQSDTMVGYPTTISLPTTALMVSLSLINNIPLQQNIYQ